MVATTRVDAVVLAGGMSQRFGTDKRLARLDGEELVRIAVGKLRAALPASRLWVATGRVCEHLPGMRDALPLADVVPGRGPLGGIAAGLRIARVGIFVLACDLPRVRAGTIVRVAAAGVAAARPAAVRTARGWEPLIAYYPSSASNHVEAALSHGRRAPHTMLDRAGAVAVRVSDRSELVNVNTPADLAVAAQR